MVSYALQIYFDFSSYSDMAIGCARALGYELQAQLRPAVRRPQRQRVLAALAHQPVHVASSSTSTFRSAATGGGRARTNLNLMLTMALGGLWHGAGANFVLWGALHGAALGGPQGVAARPSAAARRRSRRWPSSGG